MISLNAHAKINLTLEVLERRVDGYHEIRSVMQTISLCDRLYFEEDRYLNFQCADSNWVANRSLASRAAELLKRHMSMQQGAKITFDKCIPLSSGLGGDSSDAVAVLRGLVRLWGGNVTISDLAGLAATLGSDMPFFFSGGTALVCGRGDIITVLPEISCVWLVLLFPNVPCLAYKTATMYSLLRPEHFTCGESTDALVTRLGHGSVVSSGDLFNVFEKVARSAFSGLEQCWTDFQQIAGVPVHLAGAGPTLFTMFDDEVHARHIQQRLQDAGMNACLAVTCSI